MIRAEPKGDFTRLAARAATLAETRQRRDDRRWRSARWLWPGFTDRTV